MLPEGLRAGLVIAATVLAFASYVPYLRGVFAHRVTPHPVSWFVWTINTGLVAVITTFEGSALASVPIFADAAICLFIGLLGVFRTRTRVYRGDVVALLASLSITGWWLITQDSLIAVVLIMTSRIISFIPSVTKAWRLPETESSLTYLLTALSQPLVLASLASVSVETVLSPMTTLTLNGGFALLILIRRRHVSHRDIVVDTTIPIRPILPGGSRPPRRHRR